MKKNSFIVRYRALFLIAVLFSGIFFSCNESEDDLVKPKTITDVIYTSDQFTILKEIIMSTKMGDALRTDNLTLFAPNNAAFQNSGLTAGSITSLPKDSAISFVNNHILGQRYEFAKLPTGNIAAKNKATLSIKRSADSTTTVNNAQIITRNIKADNGIIQVVNQVLIRK